MDKFVYAVYPVLILILAYGARLKGKGAWNEEFMTLQQTKYIQGFFALCIMLHHIGQETCASWQRYKLYPGLEFFVPIGYFFVAMFVFCSGYGCYKSYRTKPDYLKGFFHRRILPLILAFYSTGLIFLAVRILMKQKMDRWTFLCYLSGWKLSNPNAWYVIVMPFFYFFFYLCFRFLKKEWMKIGGVMVLIFAYTFLGTWVDHNDYWMRGEWWYNSVHLFWIGILFARFEKPVIDRMKKGYLLWLALAVVGCVFFFRFSQVTNGMVSYYGEYNRSLTHMGVVKNRWICLSVEMLASFCFVWSVCLLNLKLQIGNRFLKFMGTITLEFYLIHGLFLELFAYQFCDVVPSITRITNVALLILVVFVPSIPAAVLLKKFHNRILNLGHRSANDRKK